jgi:hypothetical protein
VAIELLNPFYNRQRSIGMKEWWHDQTPRPTLWALSAKPCSIVEGFKTWQGINRLSRLSKPSEDWASAETISTEGWEEKVTATKRWRLTKWKSNLATLELWNRELLPDCKDQTILAPLTASLITALAQLEPSRQSTTAETNNMAQSITALRALAESLVALWEASDEKT